jgi:hypothetical protein
VIDQAKIVDVGSLFEVVLDLLHVCGDLLVDLMFAIV